MATLQQSQFLSTAQVAGMIGVCTRTIIRWAANPDSGFPPPSIVKERCKRWRASVVEDWLRSQEKKGR